jgi:hypothetical protein
MTSAAIALLVMLAILGVAAIFGLVRPPWKKRLESWATQQDLTLIGFRSAMFFEGPDPWDRSDEQGRFEVWVKDHNGVERRGWVVFSRGWDHKADPDVKAEVTWD